MSEYKSPDTPAYRTYGEAGPDPEMARQALASIEPIHHARAYYDYSGVAGGGKVSVRDGFNRHDYNYFRSGEAMPQTSKGLIDECMGVYRFNPILRNVVDMMASFGCQGIEILHPSKTRQKTYRHWFQKVGGPGVSQHFLRTLYSAGNVFAKRGVAKVNESDLKDMQRGFASMRPDMEYEKTPKPKRNEIPIKYTFLNPSHIEMVHGELATFMGHPVYMLRVPTFLMTMIKTPKSPTEAQMVADLPAFIREPIQRGEKFILLDNDKMAVYHYMKDDWQTWADPLATSILNDLNLYGKMKLADQAALDGAISKIRVWKLGDLKEKIQAGPAAFQKLHDMLLANVGGGSMDLIWDAAISLDETSTDVVAFLGEEKYAEVKKSIYAGLGIPQSLTGGGTQGAGFTNNAISLKTLIERLQYGRNLLTSFWQHELKLLQEALGDKQPARVMYDNMTLYDEAAEKMVWVQLIDRDLVSVETMQERFGLIPEVEQMRMKRETNARKSEGGKVPNKAGPFHNAQFNQDVIQTSLQQGTISPTEAGVVKEKREKGDKSLMDYQSQMENKKMEMEKESNDQKMVCDKELHEQTLVHKDNEHKQKLSLKEQEHKTMLPVKKRALQQKVKQNKGQPQQGRPKNSKDTVVRKRRRVLPKTKAVDLLATMQWARDAQKAISEHFTPIYLQSCEKKNVRSLTISQTEELEAKKFSMLWNTPPMSSVTAEYVQEVLKNPLPDIAEGLEAMSELREECYAGRDTPPTVDELRELQVSTYALYKGVTDAETDD
jgi:hypothetical protein